MEYKVISINPVQKNNETGMQVALELEGIIKKYHVEGWQYVRIESLKTWVAGDSGCFGIGAKPGYYAERQVIVFQR